MKNSTPHHASTDQRLTVAITLIAIILTGSATLSAQQTRAREADRMIVAAVAPQNSNSVAMGSTNLIQKLCSGSAGENLPAWNVDGWESYLRLWTELSFDAADPSLRKYLGLPIGGAAEDNQIAIKSARGRSAPAWLGWKSGTYRQIETPHFQIFSHADEDAARDVAIDLERVFWVWTQMFFPLWEAQPQVALHLRPVAADQSVAAVLSKTGVRLSSRRKLRIVLLKDAEDYARTLGQSVPGIEQSTGFYSDARQTSFFYPSSSQDAVASRRHELVHQLFRESTRSRFSDQVPGATSDFWLIEGIAGYFESLQFDNGRATIGGWDSPRLQFARYRVLGNHDFIPLAQLRQDGQLAAQQQADLARWYANAIAYTHLFMDGDSASRRRWLYQQLASLYAIPVDVPGASPDESAERALLAFLTVDDIVLVSNPSVRRWTELCLSGCQTTDRGLATVAPSDTCVWIDLARQPIGVADVTRLSKVPDKLDQLSLEATRIDDTLADWLRLATSLRELDLSWTSCGDSTITAITGHSRLQTLWLTGTKVTDASIPLIAAIGTLESIDLQRTEVTPNGLARLRNLRPDCNINPLQLRAP